MVHHTMKKKKIINDTASSDEITIKEVSDDEIVISESSVDFSKELEKGMETLGKKSWKFFKLYA